MSTTVPRGAIGKSVKLARAVVSSARVWAWPFAASLAICLAVPAELQNVQVNGATYTSVEETALHIGVIQGVIVDPAGKPAPGATIKLQEEATLVADTGDMPPGQHRERTYHVPKGRNLLSVEGKTNAKGEFAFDTLPLSPYTIDAFSENGRYHGQFTLSTGDPQQTLRIAFEPAVTIRGRVVDSAGRPAAAAHVDATRESALSQRDAEHWSGFAKTGEDGTFAIPGAPIARYTFLVSYRDLVGQYKRGVKIDGAPLEFVVFRAGSVRGTVIDEVTGFPMYGIPIYVRSLKDNINQNSTVIETDDDGRFEIDRIYPGDCAISLMFANDKPRNFVLADGQGEVTVPEGSAVDVTLKMRRGAVVTGRVVDADSGKGIFNAHIGSNAVWSSGATFTNTDAQGNYRLAGLHPGTLKLEYQSAIGYPQGDRSTTAEVVLDYGQTVTAPDIRVARGLAASGRVVDADGNGALGVEVFCEITGRASHGYQLAMSGPDGVFQVLGLQKGDSVRFHGTRHFGGDAEDELVSNVVGQLEVGPEGLRDVTIAAYPPGAISGVLLDREKKPLSDARVRAEYLDKPSLPFSGPDTRADDSGRFTVKHLAIGHYALTVHVDGRSFDANLPAIEIAQGGHVKELAIIDPGPGPQQ